MTKYKLNRPELLAPAGSYASFTAALEAGADAVYMGGPFFGARAYADNPDEGGLLRALDHAHLRNKKIYLTVNTLLKENEIGDKLFSYLAPLYENGLDGVIVQDLGVIRFLRKNFPELPLHGSTQMAVSGPEGARLLARLGLKRLVLPRELSREEIKEITRSGGLETEVFIHGALCYACSGQCLMSSFLGGRSGNRGRCAQPCRLEYQDGRMMNMRDLCALDELPFLYEAGVASLKIEGRMKSPAYTAGVTAIYRRYLDMLEEGKWRTDPADRRRLSDLFDRGGFTDGYFRRHNGADMLDTGAKKTHVKLAEGEKDRLEEQYLTPRPIPVSARLTVMTGRKAELILEAGSVYVCQTGEEAQPAQSRPLDAEQLRRQIEKTGESPFTFDPLVVETDGKSFLPLSALNSLRREALKAYQNARLAPIKRMPAKEPEAYRKTAPRAYLPLKKKEELPLRVMLDDPAAFSRLLEEKIEGIYLPADYVDIAALKKYADRAHEKGKKLFYALPYFFRDKMREDFLNENNLLLLKESGVDGFLVRSPEELGFLQEHPLPGRILADAGLYGWNREALLCLRELGAQEASFGLELHEKDIAALGEPPIPCEQLIYGRLPLMLSAQCLFKTRGECLKAKAPAREKPHFTILTDRKNAEHVCEARCRYCYSVLYNAVPLYLADMPLYGDSLRLHFTTEEPEEIIRIIRRVQAELSGNGRDSSKMPLSFTRGNYKKGVE